MIRKLFDLIVAGEASPSSKQEPDCTSSKFANTTCWGALAEKFFLHQCHDCHGVSFAETSEEKKARVMVRRGKHLLRHMSC